METTTLNVLIGGEAGQGLVTIGQILARTLVRSGYHIVVTQSYQSRIRGGHNTFAVRVSTDQIVAPQESVDLLVALNEETVALHRAAVSSGGLIVVDQAADIADDACLRVPYAQLASDKFRNVAALGIIGSHLALDETILLDTMEAFFGKKDRDVAEENRRVLTKSLLWCAGRMSRVAGLPPVSERRTRLMLNGNEAIALGALSAGVKLCSFYPMTPSTSIPLNLTAHADLMGIVVEQAEDEIAAINMAIGASFAGAPSLVPTSGGGFALMCEGVSLAAMTETPVVIVVAQRPGPATGLPTCTEQGDLELVLYAGHGEFPRAVFAPGTIEQCFHLTRRAFEVAERYQTPVFVLTDQYLADSYRAVEPIEMAGLSALNPIANISADESSYRRYALTEDGVSPFLRPGLSEHLVIADSDEHTEDGHLTERHDVRNLMVEKRLRKGNGIAAEVIPPDVEGDDKPDILLVSWGSSEGAVAEAADRLRTDEQKVGTLSFSQVWPLVPEQFMPQLERAKEVVSVEANATGQFARLIRRETGFEITRQIHRYDGLPFTPEYVLDALEG